MEDVLHRLTQKIVQFRKDRDWEQFHNPKDQALSLVLEAAELMEHMQWKQGDELHKYIADHKQEIGEELADVLYWTLLMAHDFGIDLIEASDAKMIKNEAKYPVAKVKGRHTKYTKMG